MMINQQKLKRQIQEWLEEDIGFGDISVQATVAQDEYAKGIIYAKETGVIAGLEVARLVFTSVDPTLQFRSIVKDGQEIQKGEVVAEVEGKAASILTGERLALNLMQRMSGIASMTNQYVLRAREGSQAVRVVDTRKTTPGLRMLEKYAVRMGGGHNHRYGLFDAVMIKDNHIKASGGIKQAIAASREFIPHTMKVEVEVESLAQVEEALEAKADIIMLDNMGIEEMKKAVALINGRAVVEASGGVSLDTIARIAETGVDVISVGALTHSVKALDISLDLNQRKR
ncbi:carboxylating nicotinate-nucleotide diphosphorylase [Ammoniphilus sp. CFH 90114]|uniref:carboxylating nicotinate-nucleotide diphosphorylase n=1 Tax=Ammoniphilus sp. CFH 90114 TaxID=2493665 RepID=UPI00100EDEB4|nr:carboxylating nicotinate-nucleotide diphosphorylase [Ammoniphilus sp. CFH 90114]RXT09021.1 carboxylating nicotinate-nucleotide diphosphorylase [Ammoniphilus sp. CFH 90114]